MTTTPNRGAPTPPIELAGDPSSASVRFAGSRVEVDDALLTRLRGVCREVTVDDGLRAESGRDWWPLTIGWALSGEVPSLPAVVARPASVEEVAGVVAACHAARVPVTAAGGRSGVCGASLPVAGGVVLDLCGLSGVVDVDDASLLVDVRAGTFGDVFEEGLRADHSLTLGHWPQSMSLSTVGGWVACRGAGQYSTRYGKIEDMVAGLEVVLADGRVLRTGGCGPRAAVGPDLTQVFVGSEGTLGVITEARLRVRPVPPAERRSAYGFASFEDGLDACRRILRRGATPAVLRLYDARESKRNFDVEGLAVLIVLDEAEPAIVDAVMGIVVSECASATPLDDALVGRWLGHRNDVSALASLVRRGIVVDTIEIAARWSALPSIYASAIAAVEALPGTLAVSAHQSHSYTDGACLYFTFAGMPNDQVDATAFYVSAWDAVSDVTLSAGGALSHHHGVGLNRARFMPRALGGGFDVLASLKGALDPNGVLNPGKLGLPSPFGDVAFP